MSDIGELSNITEQQQVMLIRSLLTSLGQLKFRHVKLLDSLCAVLTSKITDKENMDESNVKTKDLAAFLLTTATLNYCPKNSSKLYEVIFKRKKFSITLKLYSANNLQIEECNVILMHWFRLWFEILRKLVLKMMH